MLPTSPARRAVVWGTQCVGFNCSLCDGLHTCKLHLLDACLQCIGCLGSHKQFTDAQRTDVEVGGRHRGICSSGAVPALGLEVRDLELAQQRCTAICTASRCGQVEGPHSNSPLGGVGVHARGLQAVVKGTGPCSWLPALARGSHYCWLRTPHCGVLPSNRSSKRCTHCTACSAAGWKLPYPEPEPAHRVACSGRQSELAAARLRHPFVAGEVLGQHKGVLLQQGAGKKKSSA